MKTLGEACQSLMDRLPLDHPITMKFNPERLAADLRDSRRKSYKNLGIKDSQISEGPAWIGSKGQIIYASENVKRHYLRCADQFGEDAAKIWAWQQCYIVNPQASYIDLFREELKDGKPNDTIPETEQATDVPARDWKRESSGEGLDDLEDGLPF